MGSAESYLADEEVRDHYYEDANQSSPKPANTPKIKTDIDNSSSKTHRMTSHRPYQNAPSTKKTQKNESDTLTIRGSVMGSKGTGKSCLIRRLRGEMDLGSEERKRRKMMALIPWKPPGGEEVEGFGKVVQLHIVEKDDEEKKNKKKSRRRMRSRGEEGLSEEMDDFVVIMVDPRREETFGYAQNCLRRLVDGIVPPKEGEKNGSAEGESDEDDDKKKLLSREEEMNKTMGRSLSVCILLNFRDILSSESDAEDDKRGIITPTKVRKLMEETMKSYNIRILSARRKLIEEELEKANMVDPKSVFHLPRLSISLHESSMMNCYGLKHLHEFIHVPYLHRMEMMLMTRLTNVRRGLSVRKGESVEEGDLEYGEFVRLAEEAGKVALEKDEASKNEDEEDKTSLTERDELVVLDWKQMEGMTDEQREEYAKKQWKAKRNEKKRRSSLNGAPQKGKDDIKPESPRRREVTRRMSASGEEYENIDDVGESDTDDESPQTSTQQNGSRRKIFDDVEQKPKPRDPPPQDSPPRKQAPKQQQQQQQHRLPLSVQQYSDPKEALEAFFAEGDNDDVGGVADKKEAGQKRNDILANGDNSEDEDDDENDDFYYDDSGRRRVSHLDIDDHTDKEENTDGKTMSEPIITEKSEKSSKVDETHSDDDDDDEIITNDVPKIPDDDSDDDYVFEGEEIKASIEEKEEEKKKDGESPDLAKGAKMSEAALAAIAEAQREAESLMNQTGGDLNKSPDDLQDTEKTKKKKKKKKKEKKKKSEVDGVDGRKKKKRKDKKTKKQNS